MGDVGGARVQPRRQRRAEVGRRDRGAAARRGLDRHARGADLGEVACAAALTAGTALGGWRIIRTVGRRIYRIRPEEGLASQTASAGVIFGASLLGAPVSTTQVVASSVVGVGVGRRRWHHVHWRSCATWRSPG